MTKISTTESLLKSLSEKGMVERLNEPADLKCIQEMNRNLVDARREFKFKELKSIEAASKSVLTT